MKSLVITGSLILLLLSALAARAESPVVGAVAAKQYDYNTSLKISQDAIDGQVGDYVFTAADGSQRSMQDFRGKPLVLSMVYTSCYQICPMTTRHLSKIVDKAREALGHDSFEVIMVGFDTPVDTPDAMQYFANKQGVHNKNWHLLSGSAETMKGLAKDTGFLYYPSPNGFDHLIQATIIDAQGVVYRQVYGQVFETPQLVEPLKELVYGRPQPAQTFLADLGNKIRFFCTVYDPMIDGYIFDYSLFIGMFIGGSIILMIVIFVFRELRKHKDCTNT